MKSGTQIAYVPLHAGGDQGRIIGKWAEDMSEYRIDVPHQLREQFLVLLNNINAIIDG